VPLRRFSPKRGYYEAIIWWQIASGGFVVLVLGAVAAIVLSIRAAQLTPK